MCQTRRVPWRLITLRLPLLRKHQRLCFRFSLHIYISPVYYRWRIKLFCSLFNQEWFVIGALDQNYTEYIKCEYISSLPSTLTTSYLPLGPQKLVTIRGNDRPKPLGPATATHHRFAPSFGGGLIHEWDGNMGRFNVSRIYLSIHVWLCFSLI